MLKLDGSQVAEGRVDPLAHVDIFQEVADLLVGIIVVPVFGQVHSFLFDGAYQPFGVAILPSGADAQERRQRVGNP